VHFLFSNPSRSPSCPFLDILHCLPCGENFSRVRPQSCGGKVSLVDLPSWVDVDILHCTNEFQLAREACNRELKKKKYSAVCKISQSLYIHVYVCVGNRVDPFYCLRSHQWICLHIAHSIIYRLSVLQGVKNTRSISGGSFKKKDDSRTRMLG